MVSYYMQLVKTSWTDSRNTSWIASTEADESVPTVLYMGILFGCKSGRVAERVSVPDPSHPHFLFIRMIIF